MRDDGLMVDGKLPVDPDVDLHQDRQASRRQRRRRPAWDVFGVIALGGGLGSLPRYGVEETFPSAPGSFPIATFAINVAGSFALGFLMVYLLEVWSPRRYLRPFLAVGFLGGFTTFSTYAAEIHDLVTRSSWLAANAYAIDSLVAGLAAVWAGVTLARLTAGLPVRRGRRAASAHRERSRR